MGITTQREKGDAEAIPFLRRSIELDPNFASAHAALGVSYANLSQPSLSAENLSKAFELRERVSEKERLHISALYYALVTGELEKEAQTYQLWIQSYPHDANPHGSLLRCVATVPQQLRPPANRGRKFRSLTSGIAPSLPKKSRTHVLCHHSRSRSILRISPVAL